jgi:beta-mannosidase
MLSRKFIALSEGWDFKSADSVIWYKATVPGCNFTDLNNAGIIDDPFYRDNEKKLQWIEEKDWEYRASFMIEKEDWQYSNIDIFFEGLDTYADVFINGKLVLKANNMFRAWSATIKEYLKIGLNELFIYFHSPIKVTLPKYENSKYVYPAENEHHEKKLSVFTRKAPYHFGWDWGPRLVSSGIWRKVFLNCYDTAIINDIYLKQVYLTDYEAVIEMNVEVWSPKNLNSEIKISSEEKEFATYQQIVNLERGLNFINIPLTIQNPKRWWTNGLGEPFLYTIFSQLFVENIMVDVKTNSIGLRTLEFVNKLDENGESFYFKLNGEPIFMKGANYIPADSFMSRVNTSKYEEIFQNTTLANMNMLRVWGGGVYEADEFYDLADKYGILIWQDFMFACTMYPGDDDFLENVGEEAIYNLKRLRNHPSLALWCGNNEIEMGWQSWDWQTKFSYSRSDQDELIKNYKKLFHQLLPELVTKLDSNRAYLPSSPISLWEKPEDFTKGDNHYWGVWHGNEPFQSYLNHIPRFMSEYGFQSFPPFQSVQKYSIAQDWRLDSEVMKIHQKHSRGNQLIMEYMERDYHIPIDFADFLFVGQVMQAEGLKIGLEAHRRAKPYCQGSLYWQLNDCWPVASWSSVDYYGQWKALHYFVKKAFSEILVSPVLEDETLKVYVISDKLINTSTILNIMLYDLSGKVLYEQRLPIQILANSNTLFFVADVAELLGDCLPNESVLYTQLYDNEQVISENTLYFVAPKKLILRVPNITFEYQKVEKQHILYMISNCVVKNVWLDYTGDGFSFSDNYFDLLPNQKKKIIIETDREDFSLQNLNVKSLVDTFINAFTLD